jgi:hypothetical protein
MNIINTLRAEHDELKKILQGLAWIFHVLMKYPGYFSNLI